MNNFLLSASVMAFIMLSSCFFVLAPVERVKVISLGSPIPPKKKFHRDIYCTEMRWVDSSPLKFDQKLDSAEQMNGEAEFSFNWALTSNIFPCETIIKSQEPYTLKYRNPKIVGSGKLAYPEEDPKVTYFLYINPDDIVYKSGIAGDQAFLLQNGVVVLENWGGNHCQGVASKDELAVLSKFTSQEQVERVVKKLCPERNYKRKAFSKQSKICELVSGSRAYIYSDRLNDSINGVPRPTCYRRG